MNNLQVLNLLSKFEELANEVQEDKCFATHQQLRDHILPTVEGIVMMACVRALRDDEERSRRTIETLDFTARVTD